MLATWTAALALWAIPTSPAPFPAVYHQKSCPDERIQPTDACYRPDHNDVFLPGMTDYPFIAQHEVGHAYDRLMLNDGKRARIVKVMNWGYWQEETFANFYSGCRLRLDPKVHPEAYGHWKGRLSVAARCRLIARAGT